jgi:hypothetical protein
MRVLGAIFIFLLIAAGVATEATAERWQGATVIECSNLSDSDGITILCGGHTLTMRQGDPWSPEFRRLTHDNIPELYLDRAFECSYAFAVVDYWHSPPHITERFYDCHQKQHSAPVIRLRRNT